MNISDINRAAMDGFPPEDFRDIMVLSTGPLEGPAEFWVGEIVAQGLGLFPNATDRGP